MFQVYRKELMWGGRRLVLETGKIARQADGAVLATYGGTTVLCTAVAMKSAKPGQDFFPLTVNYQEKTFAAGKIPGGFFKREGRPSEKETLTSRLIDRPIRPLFVPGFRNETQVVCTVLSHDLENDPDVVALIGSSAALTISGIPFMGPIAGCRVGYINGVYILNPTIDQLPGSDFVRRRDCNREGLLRDIDPHPGETHGAHRIVRTTGGKRSIKRNDCVSATAPVGGRLDLDRGAIFCDVNQTGFENTIARNCQLRLARKRALDTQSRGLADLERRLL